MYDYSYNEPTLSSKNPARAAMGQLNRNEDVLNKYYSPYMRQGQQIDPELMQHYTQMFSNPGQFFSQLGSGYKESPGYQFSLQQALGAGNNAAAAGGLLGTPSHQQANMGVAEGLANKDYEDYINHIMQTMGMGLQGAQGFSNRGFESGTGLGSALANNNATKAGYLYSGQAAQNAAEEARRNSWLNAIGALGGGIGSLFTGASKLFNK